MKHSNRPIRRRSFLGATAAAPAAFSAAADAVPLREKFFGCIAACHIGSSMGAVVEGWTWDRIEKQYGTFDRLASYEHYRNGWKREPGTTEDGVERQKLMITAINEKKDRVNAEDVRRIWVRDIKPESAGMVSEPFEATLLAMAKAGIPARDIGKYCDYAGLNSFARSCHPIGLINAGDPAGAVADVYEVGQLYQTSNSRGLQWASVTALAIAAATKPGATMDAVLAAILEEHPKLTEAPAIAREIERGLKQTAAARDFRAMRTAFDAIYSGTGTPYAFSSANEVVTKAVCVFRMSAANPRDAIVNAVNMGRDTDCLAAIASGISGALSGGSAIPAEWVKQVDYATTLNRFTNSQRTLRQHSDGLYEAFRARLARMRDYASLMSP
jgi:ADP-ribosylglycohydrolase